MKRKYVGKVSFVFLTIINKTMVNGLPQVVSVEELTRQEQEQASRQNAAKTASVEHEAAKLETAIKSNWDQGYYIYTTSDFHSENYNTLCSKGFIIETDNAMLLSYPPQKRYYIIWDQSKNPRKKQNYYSIVVPR